MDTKNLKIGITLGLKSITESIWTNGIKQNVLMLVHLLKNSSEMIRGKHVSPLFIKN